MLGNEKNHSAHFSLLMTEDIFGTIMHFLLIFNAILPNGKKTFSPNVCNAFDLELSRKQKDDN